MKKSILNLLIAALIPVFSYSNEQTVRMYVGTYTGRGVDNGFYVIDVDLANGIFTPVAEADAGPSPSYFCISQKRSIVYAINEVNTFDGISSLASVTALSLDVKSGATEKVKELAVPNGGPCYISIMPEEDFLLVANYGGGSIAVVRLDGNGLPSEVTDTVVFREEGIRSARGHMTATSPDGKKVYLSCLSLDKVMIFDLDKTTGKLTQTGYGSVPEGAGPRHFTFSKDGSKMFVINELGSTMTVFDIASDGGLREIQTISTLPEDWTERNSCADVHLSKDGNYLYGSNRGHNSIVTYKVAADGRLSLVGFTSSSINWPRNFTLDPSGKYLLVGNERTGEIALFTIDGKTGLPIEPSINYALPVSGEAVIRPACLKFIE